MANRLQETCSISVCHRGRTFVGFLSGRRIVSIAIAAQVLYESCQRDVINRGTNLVGIKFELEGLNIGLWRPLRRKQECSWLRMARHRLRQPCYSVSMSSPASINKLSLSGHMNFIAAEAMKIAFAETTQMLSKHTHTHVCSI